MSTRPPRAIPFALVLLAMSAGISGAQDSLSLLDVSSSATTRDPAQVVVPASGPQAPTAWLGGDPGQQPLAVFPAPIGTAAVGSVPLPPAALSQLPASFGASSGPAGWSTTDSPSAFLRDPLRLSPGYVGSGDSSWSGYQLPSFGPPMSLASGFTGSGAGYGSGPDWFAVGLGIGGIANGILGFVQQEHQYDLAKQQLKLQERALDNQLAAQVDAQKTQVQLAQIQASTTLGSAAIAKDQTLGMAQIQASAALGSAAIAKDQTLGAAQIQSSTQVQLATIDKDKAVALAEIADRPGARAAALQAGQAAYYQQQWMALYRAARTDADRQWLLANRTWLGQCGLPPGAPPRPKDADLTAWLQTIDRIHIAASPSKGAGSAVAFQTVALRSTAFLVR